MRYSFIWVHNVNLIFIELNPYSDVFGNFNTFPASYENRRLQGNRRFSDVFQRARSWSLNCARSINTHSPYFTP